MAQQVHPLVAQVRPQGVELANKMGNGEESGVADPVGLATAELVVANHRAIIAERFEDLEVKAGVARPAMQQNHRGAGARARNLVPDPSSRHLEVRLTRRQWSRSSTGDLGRIGNVLRSRRLAAAGSDGANQHAPPRHQPAQSHISSMSSASKLDVLILRHLQMTG
jgi:hypothetical protein